MERRVRTTLITTALGLALLAPSALAQTTACPTDPFITDATGDQAIDPSGQGVKQLTQPGPDNMDITGVSFAWHKDAAGKQVLSADIGIANMTMDTMPLYDSQAGNWYYLWFSVGGTQYGEPLRGYDEFSITPLGYNPQADQTQASVASFGNAFFVGTGELGLRINQSLYVNTFFEGGNNWAKPREFDPTRLFRSAGFGVSTLSPLGPLGVDIGYGFDKIDTQGRPAPSWKLHFKLGQFF